MAPASRGQYIPYSNYTVDPRYASFVIHCLHSKSVGAGRVEPYDFKATQIDINNSHRPGSYGWLTLSLGQVVF